MSDLARLLVPALRWDRAHGFRYLDGLIDDAIELGVGGFILEGGPGGEVASLAGRLHAESRHPILVAANAERGAGGAFEGLTQLPPLGALASVAVVHPDGSAQPSLDVEVVRRAARLTVRELRNVGVNWALAPVCDLDGAGARSAGGVQPASARDAGGVQSAGADPAIVAAVVAEWVDACQADAVVACAKHFPGLGRAVGAPPVLRDAVAFVRANDLLPFAAAIDAGIASVMVAPVAVPAFSAADAAMTSRLIIENVLRAELGFDGLACTVPFDREPGITAANEAGVAAAAIAAGIDLVLAPSDLSGTADALDRAAARGAITGARVRDARDRLERWAGWARPSAAREPSMDDVLWSRQLADRAVRYVYGSRPRVGGTIEVVAIPGGTEAKPFVATLSAMHIAVTESQAPTRGERAPLAIVHAADPMAPETARRADVAAVCAAANAATEAGRDVVIVVCGHPRDGAAYIGALAGSAAVLCVWDATRPMLEAGARALFSSGR